MRNIQWKKMARSWWGRLLVGAFIGGLLVAFAGIQEPVWFLGGMLVGAAVLYFLGMLE